MALLPKYRCPMPPEMSLVSQLASTSPLPDPAVLHGGLVPPEHLGWAATSRKGNQSWGYTGHGSGVM